MSADTRTPPRPTIHDVAEHAGVSTATVSRVINNTSPVATATAERVWAAVDALRYTPSAPARMLASHRTGTIGLVIPEIGGDFFAPMLRGIEQGVHNLGYDLLIYANLDSGSERRKFPFPLGEHNTDGLLVFTDSLGEAEIARLHGIDFPLVMLHRSPPNGLQIPSVVFSNKLGARQLVDHLIETHGYQRIGFMRGPLNNEDSHWREVGYLESMQAHGLTVDPRWIRHGGFDNDEAQESMEEWLTDGRLAIDAIFTGDDEAALGVMMALRQAGVIIPKDIAIVGFDDVPLSRYLSPPLTTVSAPIVQAGQVAASQLVNLIQGKPADLLTLLPTELRIRQSCGCP